LISRCANGSVTGTTDNDLTGSTNPDYLSPAGTENTTIIINRMTQDVLDSEAKELVDCNLDELWSGIYFMVQQLDSVGRDWLEQAVSSGDKWQRAASIAKNIPIIGSLAETALEQLAEVAQDLLNLYNAYSTEVVLQEIACDLFELVCAECRYPTFDEIQSYYAQNSTITGGNLAEISLKAMVDFLIGSSLAISQLAYHTIISMVLFTLYIGSTFVGLRGQRWIPIWLDNGEEYANDEWQVLCDGCGETIWSYELDLTQTLPAWVTVVDGTWTDGVGVEAEDAGSPLVSAINVLLTLNESYVQVRVSVEYERSSDGSFNDDLRIIGYTAFPSSTGRTNWIEVDETVHGYENVIYCNAAPGTPSAGKPQWLFALRDNTPGTPMIMKRIKFWSAIGSPPSPLPDNSTTSCLE